MGNGRPSVSHRAQRGKFEGLEDRSQPALEEEVSSGEKPGDSDDPPFGRKRILARGSSSPV